jgi:TRAP-type C4-dicarboxylate transport system substrate-binding protein
MFRRIALIWRIGLPPEPGAKNGAKKRAGPNSKARDVADRHRIERTTDSIEEAPVRRNIRARICAMRMLALFLVPIAFAMHAFAQPVEWKMTVAAGTAFPLGKAAARWAQIVNDGVGEGAKIKVFPGATLAQRDPLREFAAIKEGAAEFGVGSALAWSPQVPALAVYGVPWLAPTPRALDALAGDPALTSLVASRMEAAGAVLLAVAPLGHEALATAKGPLASPHDVAGLRVRAIALPLVVDTLSALGMRASAMPFAEAQNAFLAGSLDGQLAPPASLAAMRVASVGCKQVLRWGAFGDAIVFAVRAGRWAQLTEDQRALVRSGAQTAAAESRGPEREDDAIAELAQTGVASTRLTSAQRAPFRTVVEPVIERWTSAIGAEVLAAAQAALAMLPDSDK